MRITLMPCWYIIVIALPPRLQTRSHLTNYIAQPCKRKRTLPAVPARPKPSRNFSSPANPQPDSRGMAEERFPYEHNVWHGGDPDAGTRCALQHGVFFWGLEGAAPLVFTSLRCPLGNLTSFPSI